MTCFSQAVPGKSAGSDVSTENIRGLALVLAKSYEKLRQLARISRLRQSQLILYHISSQVYSYYLELRGNIPAGELSTVAVDEDYLSGEWRVIPFKSRCEPDNADDIDRQSQLLKQQLQDAYSDVLRGFQVNDDRKNQLEQQLVSLLGAFLKLAPLPH